MCLELTEGLGNQIPERLGIFLRLRSSQPAELVLVLTGTSASPLRSQRVLGPEVSEGLQVKGME